MLGCGSAVVLVFVGWVMCGQAGAWLVCLCL